MNAPPAGTGRGDHPLLHRLHEVLGSSTDSAWSLMLSGEAPWAKLSEMFRGLYGDVQTGAGKKVESKFSYIGLGPTIAWVNACNDLYYPVMHDGIESFPRLWRPLLEVVNTPYHFVSLGVGTGQKDRVLLTDLIALRSDMLYVPVDLSAEMLHVGTAETRRARPDRYMLPVQLDFSHADNLNELRSLLIRLVGDDPIMYGMLGNTLANDDDDIELLGSLADLLRPQDRLLVEVATTNALDEVAAKQASEEYATSEAYRFYALSALDQNTDLTTNTRSMTFTAGPEGSRALRIEAFYQNRTGRDIQMRLPNRAHVDFVDGEGIRVTLSRKYTASGLEGLLASAGLTRVNERRPATPRRSATTRFALDLLLLARQAPDPAPVSTAAEDIWRTATGGQRPGTGKSR